MKHTEISSYVPEALFRDGKEGSACRECHEDFAIADPAEEYRLLAARGAFLKAGAAPGIPQDEQRFLEAALSGHTRIAIRGTHGILIVCGELLPATGLLPILMPQGSPGAIARCLQALRRDGLICSPAVSCLTDAGKPERCYTMLCEQLDFCNRILRPDRETDFRLHCAHVAGFAGCRADVTALPVGPLPLIGTDRDRWTAFLLCTFLALRGDSACGPTLQIISDCPDAVTLQLKHTLEHRKKRGSRDRRFDYLNHPCFSDFSVTATGGGWLIGATLCRTAGEPMLRSLPAEETRKFRLELFLRPQEDTRL